MLTTLLCITLYIIGFISVDWYYNLSYYHEKGIYSWKKHRKYTHDEDLIYGRFIPIFNIFIGIKYWFFKKYPRH